jgi:hypothetical protein
MLRWLRFGISGPLKFRLELGPLVPLVPKEKLLVRTDSLAVPARSFGIGPLLIAGAISFTLSWVGLAVAPIRSWGSCAPAWPSCAGLLLRSELAAYTLDNSGVLDQGSAVLCGPGRTIRTYR